MKRFYEKCGMETNSRPFLIFKESTVKMIWGGQDADLDKFKAACFKSFISQ